MRTNGEWTDEFFGNYNFRPFMSPILSNSGPIWYYLPAILVGFFPWSVFTITVLVDAVRRMRQRHPWWPGYLLLACWSATPIVFWSICSTKLPHYKAPILPALALATGAFLNHRYRDLPDIPFSLVWISWGTIIFVGVVSWRRQCPSRRGEDSPGAMGCSAQRSGSSSSSGARSASTWSDDGSVEER